MPQIVSITYTPHDVERKPADRYARVPLDRATLLEGKGIADDLKAGGRVRQINVMRAETLAELTAVGRKTGPGEMGEQLVLAGLDPADFVEGTRLRLGAEAVIEIGEPRTGCARFEHIQGVARQSVAGRLGVLARVVVGGDVVVGDAVTIVATTPAPAAE